MSEVYGKIELRCIKEFGTADIESVEDIDLIHKLGQLYMAEGTSFINFLIDEITNRIKGQG